MDGCHVVGVEAFLRFVLGDFPERFHRRLAVADCLAGAVKRGRAGIDEMQNAARRRAGRVCGRRRA